MKIRLEKIYAFLKANSRYNHAVQMAFYHSCIAPYPKASGGARSLLYHILNTQSQPKIDKVAVFWQTIQSNKKSLSSFAAFAKTISIDKFKGSFYDRFFKALAKQPGWGSKTASLFIKALYQTHHGRYTKYSFWNDVPSLEKNDKLFLPVDAVIKYIFNNLSRGTIKSFAAINEVLFKYYKGTEMLIWDDLWYWGFITQRVKGNGRILGFNKAKYWAMPWSDKSSHVIKKMNIKAKRFITLLKTYE